MSLESRLQPVATGMMSVCIAWIRCNHSLLSTTWSNVYQKMSKKVVVLCRFGPLQVFCTEGAVSEKFAHSRWDKNDASSSNWFRCTILNGEGHFARYLCLQKQGSINKFRTMQCSLVLKCQNERACCVCQK